MSQTPSSTRRRGRPTRVTRTDIVEAARTFPLRELTMQAVADSLGVDRTTLRYHVESREVLIDLVASVMLDDALAQARVPQHGAWQEVLRTFTSITHDALGALGEYMTSTPASVLTSGAALDLAEDVLDVLADAGFDEETAAAMLFAVSQFAVVSARDQHLGRSGHPQQAALEDALGAADLPEHARVRALTGRWDDVVEQSFDIGLDAMIAGFEAGVRR
jgi:TetR/AcrR family tetracycline transcriptional repressor